MPSKPERYDIIVLGGGSGGLVVTAVAAQLGYKIALLEGGEMGGDCLNDGCVPSKALIAAAKMAYMPHKSTDFGVTLAAKTDFTKVMAHVQETIATIAPHDSQERFEGFGATVIREYGQFADEKTITTPSGRQLTARRIVVATGSRPAIPPIPGLQDVPYLTNESIFDLQEQPAHLAIIGGGPIGIEMAQAFNRLGSKVTVLEAAPTFLGHDDKDLTSELRSLLEAEGITIHTNTKAEKISQTKQGIKIKTSTDDQAKEITASHLLVAAGRTPNIDKLNLPAAGIQFDERKGIEVNHQLRTTNKHVFAVGDCAGTPYNFTHMAGEMATVFIQRVLFGNLFARFKTHHVPWATYTDPELAHVGLTRRDAEAQYGAEAVTTTTFPVADVDRNVAERTRAGQLKVHVVKGKIVGADMLGADAGNLIAPLAVMIAHGMKLAKLSSVIFPYPTAAEINRRVVSAHFAPMLYAPKTLKISRILFKLLG